MLRIITRVANTNSETLERLPSSAHDQHVWQKDFLTHPFPRLGVRPPKPCLECIPSRQFVPPDVKKTTHLTSRFLSQALVHCRGILAKLSTPRLNFLELGVMLYESRRGGTYLYQSVFVYLSPRGNKVGWVME